MRLIVTGGGTGGHIYPALAIAQQWLLENSENEVLYIGKLGGIEEEVCKAQGIPFVGIRAEYRKKGIKSFINYIKILLSGIINSRKAIRKFCPDVIFGTGGYVSFPAMFAGVSMKIPSVIHEANAISGKANLVLSKWVDTVLVNFDSTQDKFINATDVRVVGMPVRTSFGDMDVNTARKKLEIPSDAFVIVCFGGSGGASKINEAILGILPEISKRKDIYLIYATGKKYFQGFQKKLKDRNLQDIQNTRALPYLYNMNVYMSCADLIISRAGASTLAEIKMSNSYAIMIPSPNVVNNHQYYNATVAEQNGLGVVLKEDELSDKTLLDLIFRSKEKIELQKSNIFDKNDENSLNCNRYMDCSEKIVQILMEYCTGE